MATLPPPLSVLVCSGTVALGPLVTLQVLAGEAKATSGFTSAEDPGLCYNPGVGGWRPRRAEGTCSMSPVAWRVKVWN